MISTGISSKTFHVIDSQSYSHTNKDETTVNNSFSDIKCSTRLIMMNLSLANICKFSLKAFCRGSRHTELIYKCCTMFNKYLEKFKTGDSIIQSPKLILSHE